MYICKKSAQQITICKCVTAIFAIQRRLQIIRVTQPFQKKNLIEISISEESFCRTYQVLTVPLCIGSVIFIIKISSHTTVSLYISHLYPFIQKLFNADPTWEIWSNKGWWHFSYVRTNCIIIIMWITSHCKFFPLATYGIIDHLEKLLSYTKDILPWNLDREAFYKY